MPGDGLASARPETTPGWKAVVAKKDDRVTEITWTADPGSAGIPIGQFAQFSFSGGPFPEQETVTLPTLQVFADGEKVDWNEPTPANGTEPDRPAPVLTLATGSGAHGDAHQAATTATPQAAPSSSNDSSSTADSAARWLGGIGLLVGVLGVVFSVAALRVVPDDSMREPARTSRRSVLVSRPLLLILAAIACPRRGRRLVGSGGFGAFPVGLLRSRERCEPLGRTAGGHPHLQRADSERIRRVNVVGPDNHFWQSGEPVVDGKDVRVAVGELGPTGEYTVNYRVTSANGHVIRRQRRFELTVAGNGRPGALADDSATFENDGTPVWYYIVGAVVVLAIGLGIVFWLTRRSKSS